MNNSISDLQVNITSARITAIKFDGLDNEGLPTVTAEVKLISAGGESVTTIYIYTSEFNKGPSYFHPDDIPASIYESLGKIVADMKGPISRKMNSIDKVIEYKPE